MLRLNANLKPGYSIALIIW